MIDEPGQPSDAVRACIFDWEGDEHSTCTFDFFLSPMSDLFNSIRSFSTCCEIVADGRHCTDTL